MSYGKHKINALTCIILLLFINFVFSSKIKISKIKENLQGSSKSNLSKVSKTTLHKYTYEITTSNQCTAHNCKGTCKSNNKCVCASGYVHLYQNSSLYCSYKQKSQLAAFLFELFLPFGIGHLYIGRVLFGITKMIIVTSPATICLFTFLGILVSDKFLNGGNSSLICLGFVFFFGFIGFAWWIADLVMFGMNLYPDGNNIPLKAW